VAERQKNQHVTTTPADTLGVTTYAQEQAAQLGSAQEGTARPGEYCAGTLAPHPPRQAGSPGPQFPEAGLEALRLLATQNEWPA
jgi:hypothetical protein